GGFGMTAAEAGYWLMINPAGIVLFSFVANRISQKFVSRITNSSFLIMECLGLVIESLSCMYLSFPTLIVGMLLRGCGLGGFSVTNSSFVIASAPANCVSVVSSFNAFTKTFGMTMGMVISTTLQTYYFDDFYTGNVPPTAAEVTGYQVRSGPLDTT
ncbi:major facilitator, sugar transporter-like, partial [Kipferlia bialata]